MAPAAATPPPKAPPSPDGGYDLKFINTVQGYDIATYTWTPPCGLAACKGAIFLLHGVHAYTDFEWLSPDADNHRTQLAGSVVEKLLKMDLLVMAHDHPGHGRSSGLRGYLDSFDEMRDIAIDIVQNFKESQTLPGKPVVIIGNSMGGTTAIRMAEKAPDLVDSYLLISPAVQPPDDMFGAYGKFLSLIRPVLSATVPRLRVIDLPPSPDETIRDAVRKDSLVPKGGIRVRVGSEFLRVYQEIFDSAEDIKFKAVAILIGGLDKLVSPSGIERFVDKIQCENKEMFSFDNIGHELFREEGCESAIEKGLEWVGSRL